MSTVLNHYKTNWAEPRGFGPVIKRISRDLLPFLEERRKGKDKTARVADLTRLAQEAFWEHWHNNGLSPKSISTYMNYVKAAVNFAAEPQIITSADAERVEVQYLAYPVKVFDSEGVIADVLDAEVSQGRLWVPTYKELARWIDAIERDSDFRFIVMMLHTWARNNVLFSLRVSKQVDFEFDLIDLHPHGKRRSRKRNPVIPLTPGFRRWLEHWDKDKPIGASQNRAERRLNAMGDDIELPDMTVYVIRHFMATRVRAIDHIPVSEEQREEWMGHKAQSHATTSRYEQMDPDFLKNCALATDEVVRRIDAHMKVRSLIAPVKLEAIKGGLSA